MVYYLGRDVRVGISTEQANYGIKHASGAITISNTSSTSGDLGGAYTDASEFIPRRAGVAEVSKITIVSNVFKGLEAARRHPMVEDVIADEMSAEGKFGVLMLYVMAKTEEEWEEWKKKTVPEGTAYFYPPG